MTQTLIYHIIVASEKNTEFDQQLDEIDIR